MANKDIQTEARRQAILQLLQRDPDYSINDQPTAVGKYPAGASDTEKNRLLQALASILGNINMQ